MVAARGQIALTILVAATLLGCNPPSAPDASEYRKWISVDKNARGAKQLKTYLAKQGVDRVFPLEQLLRSDVRWKKCKAEPFAVPPEALWPHMVPTLRVVRDKIVPLVGPVEALSVYRSPDINPCLGGAKSSYHMQFRAIDMQPVNKLDRAKLVDLLCSLHRREGRQLKLGLGIYKVMRFHFDTAGFRTWGHDQRAATSPCHYR